MSINKILCILIKYNIEEKDFETIINCIEKSKNECKCNKIGNDISRYKTFRVELKTNTEEDHSLIDITKNSVSYGEKEYKKIITQYYNHKLEYFPLNTKNVKLDNIFMNINVNIKNKFISDSLIIYNYYLIYNMFLNENNENTQKISFGTYIKYNKEKYSYIDISVNRLKEKMNKCYKFVYDLLDCEPQRFERFINLMACFKLTYTKLYRLDESNFLKLKRFFINEYDLKYNNMNSNLFNKTQPFRLIENLNIPDKVFIKDKLKNIPIVYLGNKKSLVYDIVKKLSVLDIKNKKIVDMFSGSLVIPYILKSYYKDIEIECYENNTFLLNFYEYLKYDFVGFINEYKFLCKNLKEKDKPIDYFKELIFNIDIKNKNTIGLYYYILCKVGYYNISKYIDNKLIIYIDPKKFDNLLNKNNETIIKQLYEFSLFLNKIKIIKTNIKENYDLVYNNLDKNVVVYIDPPYDTNINSYEMYSTKFDKDDHIILRNFIEKLNKINVPFIASNRNTPFINSIYRNFHIEKINVKNLISNETREEVIITNIS